MKARNSTSCSPYLCGVNDLPVHHLLVNGQQHSQVHAHCPVASVQCLQQVLKEGGPARRVVHHKGKGDDLGHLVQNEAPLLGALVALKF